MGTEQNLKTCEEGSDYSLRVIVLQKWTIGSLQSLPILERV